MTTLLERLRAETRTQHEEMEAVFQLPATRDEHRQWTGTFLGFIEPLEDRIAAILGGVSHPFMAGRGKAAWLRADLRALGLTGPEIAALPRCADLPRIDRPARALGALYVFEGATLGGQIISGHLETALGFRDGEGYSYFRSYGPAVGRQWQEFRAMLLANPAPEADDVIVAAANDAFARLGAWCRQRAGGPALASTASGPARA